MAYAALSLVNPRALGRPSYSSVGANGRRCDQRALFKKVAPPRRWMRRIFARYEAEFDYVWNSLRRLGAQPKDLEDLVHDTFMTAYRRSDTYERSRPLKPWLFGIAYRVFSDFRKRVHHSREVFDDALDVAQVDGAPDEALEAKENAHW